MNLLDFNGRHAAISGGATGLGYAIAHRLIQSGGSVSLWDLDEKKAASAVETLGPKAHAIAVDVSQQASVAAAIKMTLAQAGRIDALVNSAGITGPNTTVWDYPLNEWHKVIDINLTGLFICCREVVPHMLKANYGRIVNIASVAGKEGNPKASAYSASKAGVIGFTKSLGKELAISGILVNCVTPATFESPILDQLPQAQIDYMRSRIPMGRLGEAAECAALVCWLASEECSFSTAATFDISGGRTTY